MEMNNELYNDTNMGPRVNAKELRHRIAKENFDKKFDIILDIGCGTGNVTQELVKEFEFNHLYAADVDQDLLDIANESYAHDNVTYLRQDFNKDWDNLRPELKALEGKVNIVFTNFAINWIRNKPNLVANIARFLAKDGLFYGNILCASDPYDDLSPEEKRIHERDFLKIPTQEQQMKVWTDLFEKNGITIKSKRITEKITTYDRDGSWPIVVSCKLQYLVKDDKLTYEKAKGMIFEKGLSKLDHWTDEKSGRELVALKYQYIQLVAQKSGQTIYRNGNSNGVTLQVNGFNGLER